MYLTAATTLDTRWLFTVEKNLTFRVTRNDWLRTDFSGEDSSIIRRSIVASCSPLSIKYHMDIGNNFGLIKIFILYNLLLLKWVHFKKNEKNLYKATSDNMSATSVNLGLRFHLDYLLWRKSFAMHKNPQKLRMYGLTYESSHTTK